MKNTLIKLCLSSTVYSKYPTIVQWILIKINFQAVSVIFILYRPTNKHTLIIDSESTTDTQTTYHVTVNIVICVCVCSYANSNQAYTLSFFTSFHIWNIRIGHARTCHFIQQIQGAEAASRVDVVWPRAKRTFKNSTNPKTSAISACFPCQATINYHRECLTVSNHITSINIIFNFIYYVTI